MKGIDVIDDYMIVNDGHIYVKDQDRILIVLLFELKYTEIGHELQHCLYR